jgi:Cu-Zn family superoxide dismutase
MSRSLSVIAAACLLGSSLVAPALAAGGMLMGAANSMHGNVTVTAAPKGVLIRVDATGLTPGWHGIHLHEKGDCSPDTFTNAGAHVHTMTPATHGLLNPGGNDLGDLPNIFAAADGSAHAELFTQSVMLPALMDADGSAVVIHAAPDDYNTQPIGGSGARVACAIIK